MLSYFESTSSAEHAELATHALCGLRGPCVHSKERPLPHRAPGSPGKSPQSVLSGKPIQYYRPKGSQEIRHLIDEGFQAFNAGRLSEAVQIFAGKMLKAENETTIGLT